MANAEQLEILKQGVVVWNEWRKKNEEVPVYLNRSNLSNVNLKGINLANCYLFEANLTNANFDGADLSFASFWRSNFTGASLVHTNLMGAKLKYTTFNNANLNKANLTEADLSGSKFMNANLIRSRLIDANCNGTNFTDADFTDAQLTRASFVETNLNNTVLKNCNVYGISVWLSTGVPKEQLNLTITHPYFTAITVDDIHLAQFIHLLITNSQVGKVIDTLTSKVVLILGRFREDRKTVLNGIRDQLHLMNLTPIIFDFKKPVSKDLTGTITTLANMARFIIADLTDLRSSPHELASIAKELRTTPVLPIILKGQKEYSMFDDLRSYPWVLPTYEYQDGPSLIAELSEVIKPANDMAEAFRSRG